MYKGIVKCAALATIVLAYSANSQEKKEDKENHFNPNKYDYLISKTPTKPISLFGKNVLNSSKKLSKELLYKENDLRLVHLSPLYYQTKTFIEDEEVFSVLANSSLREYWVQYNSTNNKFKRKRALKSFAAEFEKLKDKNPENVSRHVYKEEMVKSWYDFDFDSMSKTFVTAGLYKSEQYGCMLESTRSDWHSYNSYRMPVTSPSIVVGSNGQRNTCVFTLSFGDDEKSAEAVEEVIENVSIDADIRVLGKIHYDLLPVRGVFMPTGELGIFESDKDKLIYQIESDKPENFQELLSWTMAKNEVYSSKKERITSKELVKIINFTGSYALNNDNDLFRFRDGGNELLVWTKGSYRKYSTLSRLVVHSQTEDYIRYKLSAISAGTLANAPAYFDLVFKKGYGGFVIRKMDQRLNVSSDTIDTRYTNKIEEGHEEFLAQDAIRNKGKQLVLTQSSTKKPSKTTTTKVAKSNKATPETKKRAQPKATVMAKDPKYAAKCDRDLQDLGSFFSGQHVISTQSINAPLAYVFPRLKKILIEEEFVIGEHMSEDEFVFYEIVSPTRRYTTVATFKENKLTLDLKMPAGTTVSVNSFKDYFCGIYQRI